MSTGARPADGPVRRWIDRGVDREEIDFGLDMSLVRAVALAGVALLVASYASVFYYFIDIAGNPASFLTVSVVALAAATVLAGVLTVRRAALVALAALAVGLTLYVTTLPKQPPLLPLLTDAVALTTGRTLLLVTNLDVWVITVAPAPLFLTWYLALRRRYVASVLVGGGTLMFLILTGDTPVVTALLGVVGAIVAVAVGDMDRRGDSLVAAESLAIVLAAMILLAGLAPLVPAGADRSTTVWSSFQSGGAGPGTVEGSLVDAGNDLPVQGNLSLSPDVRFRVRSNESTYWQVGSYDRYIGDGWIRTGGANSFDTRRAGPPGDSRRVDQTVTAVDELGVLPAAWKPVSVSGPVADRTKSTDGGTFVVDGTLSQNATYSVRSQVPVTDGERLRTAGTDYPSDVADRYTEVPSSMSDRVAERTARLTANADSPYDTARVIERWLANNKSYSLNVSKPDGDIAERFLFEMDAGYCTYFATTMVAMLRTQDIPARFAVGYTPGERVAQDEWVVRGLNAHAWVQAYFPETGWVRFDPTPAAPRDTARDRRLNRARSNNRTGVDMPDTGGDEWTPTDTATPAPLTPPDDVIGEAPGGTPPTPETPPGMLPRRPGGTANITITGTDDANATGAGQGGDGGSSGIVSLPELSREESTLLMIVAIGLVVGLRRSGVAGRAYRALWLRYQPREDPLTDTERAYDRLEHVLAERYRPRESGETVRQYIASIGADERARTVSEIRERARYAGAITREEADTAVEIVDDVVTESKRI